MKKILIFLVVIILIAFSFFMSSRIRWSRAFSPGLLSQGHEDFDLSGECDACHTKSNRLDNNKCLSCHKEIDGKIKQGLGLHARISRECSECHSEHHGRDYNPVHFEENTFDHNTTGYQLEGIHNQLKCEVCHLKNTYLLDKIRCIHCHQDIHKGENGEDCDECHNQNSFIIE